MSHKDAQSHTPANPPQPVYTLDPLRTEGPDSLQSNGIHEIDKITLREIEITWENANNEVIIRKANDIFKAARDDTPLLPDTGTISGAKFELHLHHQDRPHWVRLHPPGKLLLEHANDARFVFAWLDQHHFRMLAKLTNALAILLLGFAAAVSPLPDDDADDPQDDTTDHAARSICP